MNEKTVHDLSMHESMDISPSLNVTRVPGGWIYKTFTKDKESLIFVPFSTEFVQPKSGV